MPLHPHGDGCSWPAPAPGRTLSQEETHLWGRRNGDGKGADAAGAEGLLSPPDGSPTCGHRAFLTHFSWSSSPGGGAGGGQMQSPTMQLIPTHNTDKIQLQDALSPCVLKTAASESFYCCPMRCPAQPSSPSPPRQQRAVPTWRHEGSTVLEHGHIRDSLLGPQTFDPLSTSFRKPKEQQSLLQTTAWT